MIRERGYHVLFGLAIMALLALGVWWVVFFLHSIEAEREAELGKLRHVAIVAAMDLGHQPNPPTPMKALPGQPKLSIVKITDPDPEGVYFRAVPRHPGFAVRMTDEAIRALDDKLHRRRLMFIGEGTLLILLLGVCTIMLHRLIRAEKRNRRRMEAFLGAVTHEMKTPLTGIQSLFQTMAAGRVPAEQLPTLLAMGLKEAERLEHMVENVLVAGRLRADHHGVRAAASPLRAFVDSFMEHRQSYLAGSSGRLRMVWEPESDDVTAIFDATALHTVLENLTDNAFKYGGAEPDVTLRVRQTPGCVQILVEDKGIGFPPELGERLFVPFRRALSEGNAARHGTGLGLSIARALTRRMGGTLTAESDGPDKGARFIVELEEERG